MRWLVRRLPIIVAGYLFCWLAAVNNLLSDWISSLPVGLIQLAFENWLISQWAAFVFLLAGLAGSLILYFRGTLADAALLTASLGGLCYYDFAIQSALHFTDSRQRLLTADSVYHSL